MLEKFAAATGVDIVFYESEADQRGNYIGANGFYHNGTVYLDVHAGAKSTSEKEAVLITAAHEFTHFIRENTPRRYNQLKEFVTEHLLENGYDFETLVERKIKAAQKDGGLSRDAAIEEVVADACEMVMGNSKAIERLAKEKPGLAKRIADWLHEFFSDIRKAFEGVEARHEEAKAMLDYMEELTKLWDDALVEASENRGGTKKGPSTKFSYAGRRADGIEVYETSTEVKAMRWGERRRRFMELMENQYLGRTARFLKDGEVLYARFAKEDVKKNIYGDTKSDRPGHDAKINAGADGDIFELVENASYDHSEDERGKTIKAHRGIQSWDYFVKKVQIDGKVFDLLANVRKSSDAEYVYSLQLNEDKSTEAAPPNRLAEDQSLTRALTASSDSIRNSEPNVKQSRRDSEGNELSQQQQEFFKDSKVRDERGNLKVMYHGTPNGTFTVFNDGTYFTENKEYADLYQSPGASMLSVKKTANAPKTYEVYLNIKKPFDIRDAEARDIYINDYIKGGNAVGINPYMSDAEYRKIKTVDWTEGEDLREFLIDNGYDYDGLILDEGATGGYGDDVKSRGVSYVILLFLKIP